MGSWVSHLEPRHPDELEPVCHPETWNRAVHEVGASAALWAVEKAEQMASLVVNLPFSRDTSASAIEELRPTCEAVILEALIALKAGRGASLNVPPETVLQIQKAVRRRVPLSENLEGQRTAHRYLSDALTHEYQHLAPSDEHAEGLPRLSEFLVDHVTAFTAASSAIFSTEERAWISSADGARLEMVHTLLRGEEVSGSPAKLLRYEIAGHFHLGVIVKADPREEPSTARLERLAASTLRNWGAHAELVVPVDGHEVWAWGSSSAPSMLHPQAAIPDALVCVGTWERDIKGFRRTHEDAATAARVAALDDSNPFRRAVILYDDVKLASLLTQNVGEARRFVHKLLDPIGRPEDSELRRSLKTYLEWNCSPAHAAQVLGVAKNTVVYRMKRVETILNRPVRDQQNVLWNALYLAEVMNLYRDSPPR